MSFTVERRFHLKTRPGRSGGYRNLTQAGKDPQHELHEIEEDHDSSVHPFARRMAMAIECKRLIDEGIVETAAELSRIAGVTRARMTQVLNLTLLAPDIQEMLLELNPSDKIDRHAVRRATQCLVWSEQRETLTLLERDFFVVLS
jgi:hypothetical protein